MRCNACLTLACIAIAAFVLPHVRCQMNLPPPGPGLSPTPGGFPGAPGRGPPMSVGARGPPIPPGARGPPMPIGARGPPMPAGGRPYPGVMQQGGPPPGVRPSFGPSVGPGMYPPPPPGGRFPINPGVKSPHPGSRPPMPPGSNPAMFPPMPPGMQPGHPSLGPGGNPPYPGGRPPYPGGRHPGGRPPPKKQGSHLMLVPDALRPGTVLDIYIHGILNDTIPVNVTISLIDRHPPAIAWGRGILWPGYPTVFKLLIPRSVIPGHTYIIQAETVGNLTFQARTMIRASGAFKTVYIQTDKSVYSPGDTVRYRAFSLGPSMSFHRGAFEVEILDSTGHTLEKSQSFARAGMLQGLMKLSTNPARGEWSLKITVQGSHEVKKFKVEDRASKLIHLSVELPDYVDTASKHIYGTVSAGYTSGRPVAATANLVIRLWVDEMSPPRSIEIRRQIHGVLKFGLLTSDIARLGGGPPDLLDGVVLEIEAQLIDHNRMFNLSKISRTKIYKVPVKAEFDRGSAITFKPGFNYIGYVKFTRPNGDPITTPLGNCTVLVRENKEFKGTCVWGWHRRPCSWAKWINIHSVNFTIPKDGVLKIRVPTPLNSSSLFLQVNYADGQVVAKQTIVPVTAPNDAYVQITMDTYSKKPGDIVRFTVVTNKPQKHYHYLVLSKGKIVHSKTFLTERLYSFIIPLNLTTAMSPMSHLVVYTFVENEVIADSIVFSVQHNFTNRMSVQFMTHSAEPGDHATTIVHAQPGSLVGIVAYDKSWELTRREDIFTKDNIIKGFNKYSPGYTYLPCSWQYSGCPDPDYKPETFPSLPAILGSHDTFSVFDEAGLLAVSSAHIFRDHSWEQTMMNINMAEPEGSGGRTFPNPPPLPPGNDDVIVPQTWMFASAVVGPSGVVHITQKVPFVITSWVASVFAFNEVTGLASAVSPTMMNVFVPYVIKIAPIPSVSTGEHVIVEVIITSYMDTDQMISVTLEDTADYFSVFSTSPLNITAVRAPQFRTVNVPASGKQSTFFPIEPQTIGEIRVRVKGETQTNREIASTTLTVTAGGGLMSGYFYTAPVSPEAGATFTTLFTLAYPPYIVAASKQIKVLGVGDILGPVVNNLHNFLKRPMGCGEQTTSLFATDTFIAYYLYVVQRMADVRNKALSFMKSGYQRIMKFKRPDNSFSECGENSLHGSTRMTAFVLKSFRRARRFIYIEDLVIQNMVAWLMAQQDPITGTFSEKGTMLTSRVQAGLTMKKRMTMYTLLSLLESASANETGDYRLTSTIRYVEKEMLTALEPYEQAMGAYALTLAHSHAASAVLGKLALSSLKTGGFHRWTSRGGMSAVEAGWLTPVPKASSVEIETAAYVLLSYVARREIMKAIPIFKWLATQQNENGGFVTTQDSVVAIQAISEFAAQVHSADTHIDMRFRNNDGFAHRFFINDHNKMEMHSAMMPSNTSNINITASGNGTAFAHIHVSYVDSEIHMDPSFTALVTLSGTKQAINISACSRYMEAAYGNTGLVVMEVSIPSGYEARMDSVTLHPDIMKIEKVGRQVNAYFKEIGALSKCFSVVADLKGLVAKQKKCPVRVYAYYEPVHQAVTTYTLGLMGVSDYCDLCLTNCPDCATRPPAG